MRSIILRHALAHVPAANDSPSREDAKLRLLADDLDAARRELAEMFPSETRKAGEELAALALSGAIDEEDADELQGALDGADDLDPAGPSRAILAILDRIAADLGGFKRELARRDDDEEAPVDEPA